MRPYVDFLKNEKKGEVIRSIIKSLLGFLLFYFCTTDYVTSKLWDKQANSRNTTKIIFFIFFEFFFLVLNYFLNFSVLKLIYSRFLIQSIDFWYSIKKRWKDSDKIKNLSASIKKYSKKKDNNKKKWLNKQHDSATDFFFILKIFKTVKI